MAVATQKSVASLMRKTLDRQAAVARAKLKFKEKQIEQIIVSYVKNRNGGPLAELSKVLRECSINDENFKTLFDDCLQCVILLGREMKQFVEVLCDIEWASRSKVVVELYSRFILNLITAHTYHCPRVLISLLKAFKAEGEHWDNSPPEELVKKWSNIHMVIAQIIATMPMTSVILLETVLDQFPYYKLGSYANRAYIHNLIWMSKYIPSLTEQIITIIISRMIIMDVNMADRVKNKALTETIFEMETETQDDLLLDTLDYSMLEMLKWLQDERDPALNIMCNIFEKIVLPTYGIMHVQFLLLYTISINQQCADRILNNLWAVAAGHHGLGPGALATRRTAASHLAGLLARCVRMPNTRLIHYLKCMTDWCHSYITAAQESTTANDNIKVHGAFLAICHSVFYLIAFKHHTLFATKEYINYVESLNLPRLVTCALNPLRTCPPQVTRSFASVTRAHQVVYCQAIIEKNNRHTLAVPTTEQTYDEWFPYDPYTLPRSGKIIWPLCIEYKDWGMDGDDETQYTNMKKKMEAEDDDFLMAASPSQKLANSLSNCISPGFKTSESVF